MRYNNDFLFHPRVQEFAAKSLEVERVHAKFPRWNFGASCAILIRIDLFGFRNNLIDIKEVQGKDRAKGNRGRYETLMIEKCRRMTLSAVVAGSKGGKAGINCNLYEQTLWDGRQMKFRAGGRWSLNEDG